MDESPEFSVTYEGPALAGGRMNVRDLMPSLLALDETFQKTQRIIDPNAPPVHLDISGFVGGDTSLEVLLRVNED